MQIKLLDTRMLMSVQILALLDTQLEQNLHFCDNQVFVCTGRNKSDIGIYSVHIKQSEEICLLLS